MSSKTVRTRASAAQRHPARDVSRKDRNLALDLPPLDSLPRIYDHLARSGLREGLGEALQSLLGKKVGMATMCSGTESPLLAMSLIAEALAEHGVRLSWEHHFSAEIVPFKQAFIERNFRPKILFRDMTKLAPKVKCETAYGPPAMVPEPGKVQILVAGFACVDFSMLNNIRRKLQIDIGEQLPNNLARGGLQETKPPGESSATFNAIYRYAHDFRPAIVILENVVSAGWKRIADSFALIDYAACHGIFDSKNYYIPHTRQRGYMICVNHGGEMAQMTKAQAEVAARNSIETMRHLSRRASSSVEDFMLDENSLLLQKSMRDMAIIHARSKGHREISWARCEDRHAAYRELQEVGDGHPYTNWKSGRSIAPNYADTAYHKAQPDRVKDTFDILLLNSIKEGWDLEYKSRFPDVSQNVDRNLGNAPPGVTGCITPSGQIFSTYRGGPLIGLEALSLQGLPIDRLHLTRETQKDLQDLAGNAMTSTVVGAALISALINAKGAIPPTCLQPTEDIPPTAGMYSNSIYMARVQPRYGIRSQIPLKLLLKAAGMSAQLCQCELQTEITDSALYQCLDCGVTVCQRHVHSPQHNFRKIEQVGSRVKPGDFEQIVRDALPSRLSLDLTVEMFEECRHTSTTTDWDQYFAAIKEALGEDLVYESARRSKVWKIVYKSSKLRLNFVIDGNEALWELFVNPPSSAALDSLVRKQLREPVATMLLSEASETTIEGQWMIRVPKTYELEARVKGLGQKVPSYRNQLEIPKFETEMVHPKLRLNFPNSVPANIRQVLSGEYELLPNCGTSNRALHKKVQDGDSKPVYLFQDPWRIGPNQGDPMILSHDHRRVEFSDTRIVLAEFHSTTREVNRIKHIATHNGSASGNKRQQSRLEVPQTWLPKGEDQVRVNCTVFSEFRECRARMFVASSLTTFLKIPTPDQAYQIRDDIKCRNGGSTIISCQLPWHGEDPNGLLRGGEFVFSDSHSELSRPYAEWFMQTVPHPFNNSNSWIDFPYKAAGICRTCAPQRPGIKWQGKINGKSFYFKPVEDMEKTPEFERQYKARPSPTVLKLHIDRTVAPPIATILVDINPVAMYHRTIASFPPAHHTVGRISGCWRFRTMVPRNTNPVLPNYTFKSTADQLRYPFKFVLPDETELHLRAEQEKELSWMILRDRNDPPVFREEVVEESRCQSLGSLLEIKLKRPVLVRGGVLADEVGFGKTVQILALIKRTSRAAHAEKDIGVPDGMIGSRATVIFAPSTLVPQWKEEIEKFWPECDVVYISDATKLKQYSIGEIRYADIVVISHTTLTTPAMMKRLAFLSSLPEPPQNLSNQRQITAWLEVASERLLTNTAHLKTSLDPTLWPRALDARIKLFEWCDENKSKLPSKRLKGEAFQRQQAVRNAQKEAAKSLQMKDMASYLGRTMPQIPKEDEKSGKRAGKTGFENVEDYWDVTGYVLSAFRFHRKVLDEETYIEAADREAIKRVRANSTWALSATLGLKTFEDVKRLAETLGVYLGPSDITRAYATDAQIAAITSQMTDAELFAANVRDPSDQYFVRRHAAAQKFIDHFVRSNTRQSDMIKSFAQMHPVFPTPLHRLLLVEQSSIFTSDNVKLNSKKDKRMLNPREARTQKLLKMADLDANMALMNAAVCDPDHEYRHSATALDHFEEELEERNKCVYSAMHEIKLAASNLMTELVNNSEIAELYLNKWEEVITWQTSTNQELYEEVLPVSQNAGTHEFSDMVEGHENMSEAETRNSVSQAQRLFDVYKDACEAYRYIDNGREVQITTNISQPRNRFRADDGCIASSGTIIINAVCGHSCCQKHRGQRGGKCPIAGCEAYKLDINLVEGPDLANFEVKTTRTQGAKLDKMNDIVLETAEHEQVLIFAQGESMKLAAYHALLEDNISAVMARDGGRGVKTVRESQAVFTNFRNMKHKDEKGNTNEKWRKVMVLDPTDPSAAGHNLVNAHVVIFLSPILAQGDQQTRDYYKQSVGRIRRPGQNRVCRVYHLLLLDSVDVNVMEESLGGPLRLDGPVLRHKKRYGITESRAMASTALLQNIHPYAVVSDPPRIDWKSKQYAAVQGPAPGSMSTSS